jgi:hypothetical protein
VGVLIYVLRGWIGSIACGCDCATSVVAVNRLSRHKTASSPRGRVPYILFQGAIERSAATCSSSPPAISPATRRFT